MSRSDKIALLWKAATNGSEDPIVDPNDPRYKVPDIGFTPSMSWAAWKKKNPLEGDRDQLGVPEELQDLFTDEQLGDAYKRSRELGRVPKELEGLFTDKQLFPGAASKARSMVSGVSSENKMDAILNKGSALKKGARDSSPNGPVREVQALLDKYGYLKSANGVDGIFGNETEGAVLEFQRNHKELGLIETGEVDKATLAALQGSSVKERPKGPYSATLSDSEARRQQERGRNAPKVSGPGRVSAPKLYQDLMAGIAYPRLCKAMVANAIAESALHYNANGDCGSYAKSKGKKSLDTSLYPESFLKPRRGRCCSFGLWQYNICGGLGNSLLGSALTGSDEEKIAILISYEKQVQFMIAHVNRKIARIKSKDSKSVDFWVDWFVRKVERPAKMDRAVGKRRQIAKGLTFA